MSCSASLFLSINSLKLPQREYSGGISVRLIQPPSAYRKKSSAGLTDGSMLLGSIGRDGGGFLSELTADSARIISAVSKPVTTIHKNLSIAEGTRKDRACPICKTAISPLEPTYG